MTKCVEFADKIGLLTKYKVVPINISDLSEHLIPYAAIGDKSNTSKEILSWFSVKFETPVIECVKSIEIDNMHGIISISDYYNLVDKYMTTGKPPYIMSVI